MSGELGYVQAGPNRLAIVSIELIQSEVRIMTEVVASIQEYEGPVTVYGKDGGGIGQTAQRIVVPRIWPWQRYSMTVHLKIDQIR